MDIKKKKINVGTFIRIIFNEINKDLKKEKNHINNNYIIAEIYINDNDINKKIRIINSYEECTRNSYIYKYLEKCNEEEIEQCEIEINGIKIQFNYHYNFKYKGKNIIKYKFKNYLTKTNYMFSGCSSLTNINLSNFNTQNVTYMSDMFSGCKSLTNINLSNFNTQNVTYMSKMFYGYSSLKKENIKTKDLRILLEYDRSINLI